MIRSARMNRRRSMTSAFGSLRKFETNDVVATAADRPSVNQSAKPTMNVRAPFAVGPQTDPSDRGPIPDSLRRKAEQRSSPYDELRVQVEAANSAWTSAFNAQDAEGLTALYTDDALLLLAA